MDYPSAVRKFVIDNFLFGDSSMLQDNKSFLETGVVDSTGMLELIMFLENTYRIKVEPEEMIPENLDSVNRVAEFVQRKKASTKLEDPSSTS